MEDDQQNRKLFIGGLPRQVDEAFLEQHFSQYGQVEDCAIVLDRITREPRGFGFVTFSDSLVANKVMEQKNHSIYGKKIDLRLAEPKRERNQEENQQGQTCGPKRIYVGDLPHDLTDEEFNGYFAEFGAIVDAVLMHDKMTNEPKGFGFVTFESDEAVRDVLHNKVHELKGKCVEVQKAFPKADRKYKRVINFERVRSHYGGLRWDDLALGIDCLFCCYCEGAYGYGHYYGCLYGTNPFYGAWNTRRILPSSCHNSWVMDG